MACVPQPICICTHPRRLKAAAEAWADIAQDFWRLAIIPDRVAEQRDVISLLNTEDAMKALSDRKWAWLLYTVLFGMVPIFIRFLISSVMNVGVVALFSPADFISFGIVLQISLLNEVRYHDAQDVSWRHRIVGLSTFIVLFYAALYAAALLAESVQQVNISSVLNISVALCIGSFVLCWCVYDRMTYPNLEGASG